MNILCSITFDAPSKNYIQEIQLYLIKIHSKIFDWFNENEETKNYRPIDKEGIISEILEHIALTKHQLSLNFEIGEIIVKSQEKQGWVKGVVSKYRNNSLP